MLTELFVLDSTGLVAVAAGLRRRSAAFGEGLQLVNILKDSASDTTEGRRYLPRNVDRAEIFALARADLETAGRYTARLEKAGAPRGVVGFNAMPMMLTWATLARVQKKGPGSKLSRIEVVKIVTRLEKALDRQTVTELWTEMRSTT